MVDEPRDRIGTRTSSSRERDDGRKGGRTRRTASGISLAVEPLRDGTVDLISLGRGSGHGYSPIAGAGRHIRLVGTGTAFPSHPHLIPPIALLSTSCRGDWGLDILWK